ncbi:MAG: ABC transporter ATP-binding protein [Candidatus Heimdallarchaeota archaeon]
MTQIQLRNISKKFHSILAVDNVSLHVDHGEYVVFLGPTGSGKSTVLKMIAGLVKPDTGSIYFDNEDVTELPPEDRNVGFVFEQFALFPHLSLLRNASYGPWVRGHTLTEAAELAKEAIDMVLLTGREDAFPNELSGGMKQRLAIARTLVAGSKALCLDEPLGALDAKIGQQLRYDLRQLIKDLELTALHATHNFEEAMLIADRIAIFQKGNIVQEGKPREVYDHPNSIFVANFLGEANNLECQVQAVEPELMKLEFQDTILTIRMDTKGKEPCQFKKGDKVILVVKTEALRTRKGMKSGTNSLVGTLEASQILGRFIKYRIDVGGTKIVSKALPTRKQLLKEGDQVTLLFSPRKGHIFPFPRE